VYPLPLLNRSFEQNRFFKRFLTQAYQQVQRAVQPPGPEGGEAAGTESWLASRGRGRSAAGPLPAAGKRKTACPWPPFPPVSWLSYPQEASQGSRDKSVLIQIQNRHHESSKHRAPQNAALCLYRTCPCAAILNLVLHFSSAAASWLVKYEPVPFCGAQMHGQAQDFRLPRDYGEAGAWGGPPEPPAPAPGQAAPSPSPAPSQLLPGDGGVGGDTQHRMPPIKLQLKLGPGGVPPHLQPGGGAASSGNATPATSAGGARLSVFHASPPTLYCTYSICWGSMMQLAAAMAGSPQVAVVLAWATIRWTATWRCA